MATTTPDTGAPWHHWPVAVVAFLFYGIAALDYTFTKLGLGFWLSNLPEAYVSYVRGAPVWLTLIWAVSVWGGLAGAYLLWQRSRWSVLLFFAAAACLAFLTVWLSLFARPTIFGMAGIAGFYGMVGSTAIGALIYIYARWERTERKLA